MQSVQGSRDATSWKDWLTSSNKLHILVRSKLRCCVGRIARYSYSRQSRIDVDNSSNRLLGVWLAFNPRCHGVVQPQNIDFLCNHQSLKLSHQEHDKTYIYTPPRRNTFLGQWYERRDPANIGKHHVCGSSELLHHLLEQVVGVFLDLEVGLYSQNSTGAVA